MATGEIGPEGGCLFFSYNDDAFEKDMGRLSVADNDDESDDSIEFDFGPFKRKPRIESDSSAKPEMAKGFGVKFPKFAVSVKRCFQIFPKLQERLLPGYIPISMELLCEPSISFKQPVDINLPLWCSTDDDTVEVEVQCQDERGKSMVIQKAKLKDLDNEIKFKSTHFSSFTVWIKEKFHMSIKKLLNIDFWKSTAGNYVFVAYTNDRSVKESVEEEFKKKEYKRTKAFFDQIMVRHRDTIVVKFGMKSSSLKKQKFDVDIRKHRNLVHFVLEHRSIETPISLQCVITQKMHRERTQKDPKKITWNELPDPEVEKTKTAQNDQKPKDRVEDVFYEEIIPHVLPREWERFVTSRNGLCLDSNEYSTIFHNYRGDINKIKLECLKKWREKMRANDSDTRAEIRRILEEYQKAL